MLRSALGYLLKLDYKYHDQISSRLLDLLIAHELPFPYQVAVTIEALGRMAPSDPRRTASELRNLGLIGKRHWYVRQKTLEAILHLPYRETAAETLAETALKDQNPWVRRAGAAMVVRGRVPWIQKIISTTLIYHADPELSRIGLYWQRSLVDDSVTDREVTNLFKSGTLDVTFLRRLKMTYLLRCNPRVADRLAKYLNQFSKSRNTVVKWHCEQLRSQLSPVISADRSRNIGNRFRGG
jgi:hypothetical protein